MRATRARFRSPMPSRGVPQIVLDLDTTLPQGAFCTFGLQLKGLLTGGGLSARIKLSAGLTPSGASNIKTSVGLISQLENGQPTAHICDVGAAGWKFRGEFRRGRAAAISLECVVALRDRREAETIARKKLVGADTITVTEVSRDELEALNLKIGDVRL
jgi:hypothetical protein